MSISIGGSYAQQLQNVKTETTGDKLSSRLDGMSTATASDAELKEACKSFEEYLVEQVLKSSKKALCPDDELEDNDYMKTFGDTLYQQYAKIVSDNAGLGIAEMLYKSIKTNSAVTVKPEDIPENIITPDININDIKGQS